MLKSPPKYEPVDARLRSILIALGKLRDAQSCNFTEWECGFIDNITDIGLKAGKLTPRQKSSAWALYFKYQEEVDYRISEGE